MESLKGADKEFFKMMTEIFPSLVKNLNLQIQETQQTPNRINSKTTTLTHLIIKLKTTNKEKAILKVARKKEKEPKAKTTLHLGGHGGQKIVEQHL